MYYKIDLFCPECMSRKNVRTTIEDVDFGQEETIFVPIRWCQNCGFSWTDAIAEKIYEKQIEAMRRNPSTVEYRPTKKKAQTVLDKYQPKHEWKRGDKVIIKKGWPGSGLDFEVMGPAISMPNMLGTDHWRWYVPILDESGPCLREEEALKKISEGDK